MSTINVFLAALAFATYLFSHALAIPSPLLNPRPLVIWHGMGDTYCAPGILEFIDMIKQMHPGIFVHSIYINEKEDEDRKAGWVSLCRHLTSKNVLRLLVTGMNTRSSGTLLSRLQMCPCNSAVYQSCRMDLMLWVSRKVRSQFQYQVYQTLTALVKVACSLGPTLNNITLHR